MANVFGGLVELTPFWTVLIRCEEINLASRYDQQNDKIISYKILLLQDPHPILPGILDEEGWSI